MQASSTSDGIYFQLAGFPSLPSRLRLEICFKIWRASG
jgi:hypothetical protein